MEYHAVTHTPWNPPSPLRRALDRQRYAMTNGGQAGLRALEALRNSALPQRFPVVISKAPRGGVDFAHAGIRDGLVKQLEQLERARATHSGAPVLRSRHAMPRGGLAGLAARPPAAIVIVSATSRQIRALPRDHTLILPYRVHLVVDLTDGPEATRGRISRRERQRFSRNRRTREWRWEESRRPEDFHEFFERFYLPTMDRRHCERARREAKNSAYAAIFQGVTCSSSETAPGVLPESCVTGTVAAQH
jgi:hypothetical protein